MNQIASLLKPRILSFMNRDISNGRKSYFLKILVFGFIGLLFWVCLFAASLRVLVYFKTIETIGDILAFKLLSMILITFFSLLVFSSILTTLSKLYLSKDLCLVHAMPVSSHKIFIARWIESTIDSSWMVLIYALPAFLAYGIVFKAGPCFYAISFLSLLLLTVIASGISSILVMIVVIITPASRIRSIFIFLGLTLFIILFLAFRFLRPERLVNPDVFATSLIYLKSLNTPSSLFLPSTWVFDTIKDMLTASLPMGLFHLSLSLTCAGTILIVSILVANALYFKGISKAQTAQMRFVTHRSSERKHLSFMAGPIRAVFIKEIKTFLRDQTQWSQLFLIAGLIIIYVYNFSVLPLEKTPVKTVYLENLFSFLNMGLALFVLTAITARFAYPAVSTEGEAYWLVKSAPISIRKFLWIKFFIYYFPLLILTEMLIVVTNIFLHVTSFMMVLSTITVFFAVPGVVAMGIGFGAAYPDFRSENPAQSVTSFGGFIFMILCAAYIGLIIILEAGPVYNIFIAGLNQEGLSLLGWLWVVCSFSLVFVLNIVAIFIPMQFGGKKLMNA